MLARRAAVIALVLASSGLTACGAAGSSLAPSPGTLRSVDATGETRVRIVIGDQTLNATLRNNPAAASVLAQLPLSLQFSPYSGQEATAKPPRPLTMTGMPTGDAPVAGDIGYYAPDGVLTLHYADIGYWQGSARLGRIDGDLSAIKGRQGPFTVTIQRAGN